MLLKAWQPGHQLKDTPRIRASPWDQATLTATLGASHLQGQEIPLVQPLNYYGFICENGLD